VGRSVPRRSLVAVLVAVLAKVRPHSTRQTPPDTLRRRSDKAPPGSTIDIGRAGSVGVLPQDDHDLPRDRRSGGAPRWATARRAAGVGRRSSGVVRTQATGTACWQRRGWDERSIASSCIPGARLQPVALHEADAYALPPRRLGHDDVLHVTNRPLDRVAYRQSVAIPSKSPSCSATTTRSPAARTGSATILGVRVAAAGVNSVRSRSSEGATPSNSLGSSARAHTDRKSQRAAAARPWAGWRTRRSQTLLRSTCRWLIRDETGLKGSLPNRDPGRPLHFVIRLRSPASAR
jgi:hypothetical protein